MGLNDDVLILGSWLRNLNWGRVIWFLFPKVFLFGEHKYCIFGVYISELFSTENLKETSLMAQWLRLHAPNAEGTVWSLVGELRSHMLHCIAKKKKKKKKSLKKCRCIYIYMTIGKNSYFHLYLSWYAICHSLVQQILRSHHVCSTILGIYSIEGTR